MDYEIVELKEKKAVGFAERTSNHDENCLSIIGGLWQKFYSEGGYEAIQCKTNGKSLGIYTDYAGDENGEYTVMTACEVEDISVLPEGMVSAVIPAGKYAKFIVEGDLHEAVGRFWQELWKMDLERTFCSDYEEYQNAEMEHAVIHMYIGIR